MNRTAAMLGLVRRQVSRSGAVAAWGSVVVILLTLGLVLVGEGAPGDLDPTSGGGTVTTDFGGDDVASALVQQPDGKLVAAGYSTADGTEENPFDFALARYLPDGRLDPTFGVGGKVTTDFGGDDRADALVLQPDGKLVAAGDSCHEVNSVILCDFALARYLPDGRLDPSFGTGGTVTTDFGDFDLAFAFALILQPDGKLVAAGYFQDLSVGNVDWALARYRPDGSLDPSFGTGGKVTTDFGGFDAVSALVLQPDGKLVAAGGATDISFTTSVWALARYLPDGSLDPSFGLGGTVTTDFPNGVRALVLQSDGKLVAAGQSFIAGFTLVRYLADGHLDPSFGIGGVVTTDFEGAEEVLALVLQPDGKLVAAGAIAGEEPGLGVFALARYLPDGSLDPSFGVGGKVTTDFGDADAWVADLVLQPGGKLVAAGVFGADFALARYRPDGRLDPTFGTGFEVKVNALVTFEPIPSTFTFTPDPTGCPAGFVGTFSFEARLTNTSESSLSDLVVAVTELTNGNLLHNADGGPGGVGARLTVPQLDGFSDGVLSPEEFVDVPFIICLHERQPFQFVVDVFGVVEASTDAQAKAPVVP